MFASTSLVFMLTEVPAPPYIDVNRELIHAFTVVQHLIARGDNRICSALGNGLQLFVCQSRGFFYHHHATHKFRDAADFAVADVEVFNRSRV